MAAPPTSFRPDQASNISSVLSFDIEGTGYDQRLYQKALDFYDNEIEKGHYHGRSPYLPALTGENKGHTLSAVGMGLLIESGVLDLQELERAGIDPRGSILIKGWKHPTTDKEIKAASQEGFRYEKLYVPGLGSRYVAVPIK